MLVVPVLTAGVALRLNFTGDPGDGTRTRGRDAIWLGHAWVDGRKKDADLAAFAARIKGTGIKDLYVHAGPLEHDGTLPDSSYPRAHWVVDAVHRTMPSSDAAISRAYPCRRAARSMPRMIWSE